MIADLKPYAEYKESGLPWLGQVPGHWDVRRLRASITDCVNGVWGAEPNGEDDLVCVRVADFDRVRLRVSLRKKTVRAIPMSARSRRALQRGDLLLEKSGGGDLQPVGAVVAYDHDEPAVCSNFVARMPMAAGYDPFFVNYLHFTLYANRVNIRSIKQTTGIQNLDGKAYLSELVAFSPPDEQAAIVRFLDWANGRLERAIRAKRKVIALLNEQKQAIIHRAVTRGLDPSVPLKPSGIPWLGDIPQHWEVRKVRTVADLIVSNVDKHSKANETDVRLCNYVDVYKNDTINERLAFMHATATIDEIERFRIREGDVIITKDSEEWNDIGVPSLVTYEADDLVCGYHLAVLRPRPELSTGAFLHRVLEDRFVATQMHVRAKGVTRYGLGHSAIKDVLLPLPPILEQGPICSQLKADLEAFVVATTRLEREIELLREYRTRLVADVVTGKLDVRDAATRLPDEAPVETVADDADLVDEVESADEEASVA